MRRLPSLLGVGVGVGVDNITHEYAHAQMHACKMNNNNYYRAFFVASFFGVDLFSKVANPQFFVPLAHSLLLCLFNI